MPTEDDTGRTVGHRPAAPTTAPDTPEALLCLIQRRPYRYAGTDSFVLRWMIASDRIPRPYLTRDEALAELRRRLHANELVRGWRAQS